MIREAKICSKPIIFDQEHFSNTDLSDFSIVGTCDIMFTKCVTKSCDMPDWSIQSCCQSASLHYTETTFSTWPFGVAVCLLGSNFITQPSQGGLVSS